LFLELVVQVWRPNNGVRYIPVSGVKRQLARQKDVLYDSIWSLDVVTRDLTYKTEEARNKVLQIVGALSAVDQWRWLIGFGNANTGSII
jgi:hypothetical protein